MTSLASIQGEPILYGDPQLHGLFIAQPTGQPVCVLLVTPLFEEKRCAHRTLIMCGRELARNGAAVLIPDLFATGNSTGSLTEVTLCRWMSDLTAAAEMLQVRSSGPLYVIGCRAGALLAAHAIAHGLPATRLLLWQPVTSGQHYLGQLRTRRAIQDNLTGEKSPEIGKYEVEGQHLSSELYAEFEALSMPAAPPIPDIRLVQCSFNQKVLSEYERLLTRWSGVTINPRCLVAEPFWHPHAPGEYAGLSTAITEELLS